MSTAIHVRSGVALVADEQERDHQARETEREKVGRFQSG